MKWDAKKDGLFGASVSVGGNRRDVNSRYLDVKAPQLTLPYL
ncbi:MAG: hypothetical protein WDO15_29530 [Bacteroidota bacterium]